MKKLFVIQSNYAVFEYSPFLDGCTECARPQETEYELGQVVYIKSTNAIGVVLGCIDNKHEELRTDMDGMRCFSEIQPATLEDFQIKDVRFASYLLEECKGKKIKVIHPKSLREERKIIISD